MKLKKVVQPTVAVLVVVGLVSSAGASHAQNVGVFGTTPLPNGNLGGLSGADATCNAQGTMLFPAFAGPWKAWLSDSTTDARTRIAQPSGGAYVRAGAPGVVIANDLADLTDGMLANAIEPLGGLVWTGTAPDGNKNAMNGFCNDWMAADPMVNSTAGDVDASDGAWTGAIANACDSSGLGLYCFGPEAPAAPVAPPLALVALAILLMLGGTLYLRRRRLAVG